LNIWYTFFIWNAMPGPPTYTRRCRQKENDPAMQISPVPLLKDKTATRAGVKALLTRKAKSLPTKKPLHENWNQETSFLVANQSISNSAATSIRPDSYHLPWKTPAGTILATCGLLPRDMPPLASTSRYHLRRIGTTIHQHQHLHDPAQPAHQAGQVQHPCTNTCSTRNIDPTCFAARCSNIDTCPG
jgi:hypothetical protein